MLWRLAVAAVSLVGFLGGATLVATQLERDVEAGFGTSFGDLPSIDDRPPAGIKPFRFDGLTLPKDIPFTLPEGTVVNPDGSITLPDGTKLPIDAATIQNLGLTLPTDGALKLPPGTSFDGSKLHFNEDGTVSIPGIGDFTIPAGSDMELPDDLAKQLLDAGYGGTNLPDTLRVPGGSNLNIPQLTSPDGGSLLSEGGTTLRPPGGGSFNLPPGTLDNPTALTLPAGTEVDQTTALAAVAGIAYLAATSQGYTPTDLPPALEPAPESGDDSEPVRVFSAAEGAVRKGSPFYVAGYVRNLAGSGLAGVTVDVYVNETEYAPGARIGSTSTGADGTFRVQVTIPSTLPAGEYVIMAGSQPARVGGVDYAGGWG